MGDGFLGRWSRRKLDAKEGVVEIYNYASVLKEHLMASQAVECSSALGPSISA